MSWTERTELLLGEQKLNILRNAHILVVGLGGVGAYAAEMIARAGVGHMTIADADTVGETNINRQLLALHSTIGRHKSEVMAERLRDINPNIDLQIVTDYIRDEKTYTLLDAAHYDYVVDCIGKPDFGGHRAQHPSGQFDGRRGQNRPHTDRNQGYRQDSSLPPGPHVAQKAAQSRHPQWLLRRFFARACQRGSDDFGRGDQQKVQRRHHFLHSGGLWMRLCKRCNSRPAGRNVDLK